MKKVSFSFDDQTFRPANCMGLIGCCCIRID